MTVEFFFFFVTAAVVVVVCQDLSNEVKINSKAKKLLIKTLHTLAILCICMAMLRFLVFHTHLFIEMTNALANVLTRYSCQNVKIYCQHIHKITVISILIIADE